MLRWSLVYIFAILFLMASAAAGWFMFTTREAVRETEALERTMAKRQDNRNEMRTKLRQALSELQATKQKLITARKQQEIAQTAQRDATAHLAAATALNRGLKNKLALTQQALQNNAAPQTGGDKPTSRIGVLSQISNDAKSIVTAKTSAKPSTVPAPVGSKQGAASPVKKPPAARLATAETTSSRTITSSLNVRAKPTVSAALVTTFRPGQKITVTTTGAPRGWHKLTGPANVAGFIKTTALMANSR